MMKAVRVTEEWQRAGVHYVRTQAMCLGFKIPLEGEFSDDTPEDDGRNLSGIHLQAALSG